MKTSFSKQSSSGPIIRAVRYHDFSCGHRVVNHESKCKHLHGHNYRVWVHLAAIGSLDDIGRVLDFSVIKSMFFSWLESELDHKFLTWVNDPLLPELKALDPEGIYVFPLNPTAENIAIFLLEKFNELLGDKRSNIIVEQVIVEETRKCSASASCSFEIKPPLLDS